MNKVILLITHLGSGSRKLCEVLNQTKRIHWVKENLIFDHPSSVPLLSSIDHKYSNSIGLYLNEILYNFQLSHKGIYQACNFIYLARNPRETFAQIDGNLEFFLNYYIFRLRRMYEMAREMKNTIFLNWEDVQSGRGLRLLEEKLHIKEKLELGENEEIKKLAPIKMLKAAEAAFELYICRMNKLALNRH